MDRQAFLLATAAMAVASPALAQTQPAATIATVSSAPLVEPYYATELGFFNKAGLTATVSTMNNGGAIIAGVASGAIDIGGSNLTSLVVAYKKGVPIKLIAGAGVFNKLAPTFAIIVRKNSAIKTAKDLEGQVVAASPLKSLGDYCVSAWMDKNGADSSKVKYIEIPFGEMETAVAQGRVAAASMPEPFWSEARDTCRVLGYPFGAIAPQFYYSGYFTSAAFAKANPEAVDRFVSAIHATAVWGNRNPKKVGPMLAAITKLDPVVIAGMSRVILAESFDPALVQPMIDFSAAFKMIDAGFPAADLMYQAGK